MHLQICTNVTYIHLQKGERENLENQNRCALKYSVSSLKFHDSITEFFVFNADNNRLRLALPKLQHPARNKQTHKTQR